MEKSEQVTIDKIDIIPISLNISQYHYLVHWTLPYKQKGHPLTCKIYSSGMSFFPILHYIFNTWCCLSTTYMIPKCLNACIIASSFSGVHCGCLAFSDLGKLKFSPTSNPHFFLICAIYILQREVHLHFSAVDHSPFHFGPRWAKVHRTFSDLGK